MAPTRRAISSPKKARIWRLLTAFCTIAMSLLRAPRIHRRRHTLWRKRNRTFCYMDMRGKLVVYSSCQSVFNTQRIISEGLGLPFNKLRVVKPKVGGAFGGKNTTFFEGLAAAVTWKTGRPRPARAGQKRVLCGHQHTPRFARKCAYRRGCFRHNAGNGCRYADKRRRAWRAQL